MTTETTPPVTPPVVPPVDVSQGYDDMSSVFDDLLTPEPSASEENDDTTPKVEAEGETPAVETTTVETPAVEPPPEIDYKAEYEKLKDAQKAAPEPAPVVETPTVEAPPPEVADVYQPDEKEFLKEYGEQWPDIKKGEALIRRAEYRDIVGYVFKEFARVYGPLVERGAAAADTVAETTTLNAIHSVHNDYDDAMYDAVNTWADGLTGTKKRMAEAIIAEGNPSEVIDLITEFKSATGRSKPKIVADDKSSAAPVVTELSPKAKQAARAIGVVESKRTTPVQPVADADDFDTAWLEAVGSK